MQAEITDVQRGSTGAVAVYTTTAVPSQAVVLVRVDWGHRYDLMQQHTGAHFKSVDDAYLRCCERSLCAKGP